MDYLAAKKYIMVKHANQYRIGGAPYVTHPLEVAALLEALQLDEQYILAGLFHDLLEDTDATEEEILMLSDSVVLDAVRLLTKVKGYSMASYIEAIGNNPIAHMVKLADRIHNLECSLVADDHFQKKYIEETKAFYVDLAKGTPLESRLNQALKNLMDFVKSCNR